ncbi:hypothetical protein PF005_g25574 [Phytophthora fragariae]|uniref:Uncharacterized protein n=2 Tax=Phytophthora TaxID=4783 RepID=A0A6A4DQ53_9STRA|nr:hypothetical protein PF003_g11259 [Phytophthora fragariae]KAE8994352.1 hypothetical protein PR002_g19959 [Phytophthora rubi]KAE8937446.1 hypothetical protein PF009_g12652 [Phytophthora fragariae]KAE8985183.1 hypothetical protein PF011_g20487 [Phytophthora fragariae]KAE9073968.1 hypothetical protein PF007_g25596 [Phytophthora fragariae]
MFVPARRVEPHLFVVPTLSTVHSGKVVVPVMNIEGRAVKLPKKEGVGYLDTDGIRRRDTRDDGRVGA